MKDAGRDRWRATAARPADIAVAAGVGVVQIGGSALAATDHMAGRALDPLGVFLLVAGPVALLLRRRRPVEVLAVTFVATMTFVLIGYTSGAVWLALIAAFFNAVLTGHRRAAQLSLLAGYLVSELGPWAVGSQGLPSVASALALFACLLAMLSVAEAIRFRRERTAEATRSREEEAARRISEERLTIAREVHDIVAHHMSLINVQASTALHLMDGDPDRARSALTAIKEASKEGLVELRAVLGALRRVDEDVPLAPAPGVDRMDDLVAAAAAAGVGVSVVVEGEPRSLAPTLDVAGYRIVQEALTNVARYAPQASATVRLEFRDRGLVVQVDDGGPPGPGRPALSGVAAGPAPVLAGGGHGIAGMRERAAVLGGEVDAGPRPGGGFRVRAWLPFAAVGENGGEEP